MSLFIIVAIFSLVISTYGQDDAQLKCAKGVCVSKLLCPNSTYTADAARAQNTGLVNLRIDIHDVDECLDYLMICCDTTSPSVHTVTEKPADDDVIIEPPPSFSGCGKSNPEGLFYTLHSNETVAQFGEFPWVVYIVSNQTPSAKTFVCGGTLIHPLFVVTTAHNVAGKVNLIARFGEWDISTEAEHYPHQEIDVEDVYIHPTFVMNPVKDDIALLSLHKEVQYHSHIQPICLPQPADQFDGELCISNGWGTVRGVYANVMKKLTLSVVPRSKCLRMLRFGGLGPLYDLHEGFMCAGGEAEVDTCKGDGGSPLACRNQNGSFVLAGMVSWGIGCGGHNLPGVYVSVNKYVAWINDQIFKTESLRNFSDK